MARFANGSTSAASFVRGRTTIVDETRGLGTVAASIRDVLAADNGYSMPSGVDDRLTAVEHELEVVRGPVSEQAASAASNPTDSRTVYVESSSTGYTLAYTEGHTYVRETYLGSERRRGAEDQFKQTDEGFLNAATDRGDDLYPGQVTGIRQYPPTNIYRFTGNPATGSFTAYVDGGTTNVFRESQEVRLSTIDASETIVETNETLRVTLNRTYETGPMEVSVARNTTDVAVTANVTVDDQRVGQTGVDGSTWIVEPRRPYTLNVTAESGGNVTVPVTETLPPES